MCDKMIQQYSTMVQEALEEYLQKLAPQDDVVCQAMKYSAMAGGKRLRPVLAMEFCRICGGEIQDVLPFACAIEMIHTYSLIHDDLPCMDDDDTRRGQPSCHVKFGYANALLAGDGLLTAAFECAAESKTARLYPEAGIEAIRILANFAGVRGMIGGQSMDLQNENKSVDESVLRRTDDLKTGKLIRAAALLGCIAAQASPEQKRAAELYCDNLGLAFQVVDDLLDVTGDERELGKPIGSDRESGKSTYVTLLGLEKAKAFAEQLTQQAVAALDIFGQQAQNLRELAESLRDRRA